MNHVDASPIETRVRAPGRCAPGRCLGQDSLTERAATAPSLHALLVASVASLSFLAGPLEAAEEKDEPSRIDFESGEVGSEPEGFFVVDGEFTIEELDGGKALAVAPVPLIESGAILGDSMKGGGSIEVKVRADRKRRSFPRFGVGLHGLSGYRLRVVPAQGRIELVKNEEVVASEAFEWTPDAWCMVRLAISPAGEARWNVEGRVWKAGEEAPAQPGITFVHEGASIGTGKASVWGTPYAGLPIYFDDILVVEAEPEEEADAADEAASGS